MTGDGPALSGRVSDGRRHPVENAAVMFTGASPEHQDIAQITGPDGRFFYPTLPPGRYTLLARAPDGRTGLVDADVGPGLHPLVEIVLEETP
jgi:protocatechuate 3,4-dioxygenase beta subunit